MSSVEISIFIGGDKVSQVVLKEIISGVCAIPETIDRGVGDREWTRKVKRVLVDIGLQKGYRVCTSGFREEADEEWLYDLVWFQNDNDDRLERLGLVMESEWTTSVRSLRFDFEKLLQANAPLKVMVCQSGRMSLDDFRSEYLGSIVAFKGAAVNCVYLVLVFMNDQFKFRYFAVDAQGKPIDLE